MDVAPRCALLLFCVTMTFGVPAHAQENKKLDTEFRQRIAPLIAKYCGDCHGDNVAEADLNLTAIHSVADARRSLPQWIQVRRILSGRQMPPPSEPQPTAAEFEQLSEWTRRFLAREARRTAGDPGPVVLRRLSNAEYDYAIRDLTGVATLQPTAQFPVDGAAGEGFTNVGDGQGMSPALVRKYLDAAKGVARHAVLTPVGFRFASHTSNRDEADSLIRQIQSIYERYSLDSGGATSLHGVRVRANEDGLLPISDYVRAILEERATLERGDNELQSVATARKLSSRYLEALWRLTEGSQPTPNWLLEDVRQALRSGRPRDAKAIVATIGHRQRALWKFNAIGHIGRDGGPVSWQQAVSPILDEQTFQIALPNNSADDLTLHLAARAVSGVGSKHHVVWRAPRLEFKPQENGYQPPAIPLRELGRFSSNLEQVRLRESARAAEYLLAVRDSLQDDRPARTLAAARKLHPDLLDAWERLLQVDRRTIKIEGHFQSRLKNVQNHASVNGWGDHATPSLLTNSAEQSISFLTLTVPARGVTVHPSPTQDALVHWRSPVNGTVRVHGRVADADGVCGNGVAWRLELASREGRSTLISRSFDNKGQSPFQLDAPLQLAKGDVLSLIISARDRNHVCDTTSIELEIKQTAGEQRSWSLAKDIVDQVLDSNPLPDSYGNPATWHLCAGASQGNESAADPIPPGSSLAKFRAELKTGTSDQLVQLAQAVQRTLANTSEDSLSPADKALKQRLLDWKGPLAWSKVASESQAAETTNYVVPFDAFGAHAIVGDADEGDLCVVAPSRLTIKIPKWIASEATFTVVGRLHAESGRQGAVQLYAGLTQPPADLPLEQIVTGSDPRIREAVEQTFAEFREIFPRALCYRQVVPVDEVVTLTLFHREDEPLQRLFLTSEENQRLERLWRDLLFVTEEPLQKLVAFEQISEFATQDRPDLVKAFKPLRARLEAKADAFRQQQAEAGRNQVDQLMRFARRAWRRPLAVSEQERLKAFYSQARENGVGHDEAFRLTLARVLTAPSFLYKLERVPESVSPQPISQQELASRLSFFLWSAGPDEALLSAAASADLNSDEQLRRHVRRMLADPRAKRLAIEFACQWLHLRDFDKNDDKNERRYPEFAQLREPMYEEVVRFFTDMMQNDRSILELIDADHTFVNGALAEHYGFEPQGDANKWRRVTGVRKSGRGGLLGMAAVLASQSGASRTSPILRGNWVYETLLGERLPRPPADVPQLPNEAPDGLSMRQLIERHSSDPACAKCHDRIDPFGFALEQFDAIGRQREQKMETRTRLPEGVEIDGLEGLRDYLARARKADIVRQFCRKLLGFALGREVQLSDEPLLDQMQAKLAANDYRFQTAVEAIVLSPQFRRIRGSVSEP